MTQDRVRFLFLNAGHFADHYFMVIFPTAVLFLEDAFGVPYGELLPFATLGFVLFGAGSIPAGWLGDKWSRSGMIIVFFIGIGGAAMLTGLAQSPLMIGAGLALIGLFAAIYHPVGIAMVVEGHEKVGRRLGVNGVFGNMGIAAAPLATGFLIAWIGWRAAFIVPGALAVAVGIGFMVFVRRAARRTQAAAPGTAAPSSFDRRLAIRVLAVVAVITAAGGIIFNSTTVSLPKLVAEQAGGIASDLSQIGIIAAVVFAVAAFAQIVVGQLIDRYPVKPILFAAAALQVPALALVATLTDFSMVAMAIVLMCLVFGQIPIGDTLIARHSVPEWRARIYSLKYVLALGVSASAVPLVGWMHTTSGFAPFYMILAAAAAVVALATLALPNAARQRAPGKTTTSIPA